MVPACAGMNDGIVGISWKTCARQNWWCGLCPTGIIKTLGFFYPSFNCKQFSFLLARTFFRNLCWGYPTQESLIPMESNQGHLVRAQDGELGRLVEPGHFGWGFSRAAHPTLWSFGGPKSLHFLHLWKNYALSLKQSSPSGLPSSRAGIVRLRAAKPFSLQGASHSLCPQGPGELLCSTKHLLGVLFWLPQ